MTDPFSQPPETAQGLSDLVGALVLVRVIRHEQAMPSSFGAGREGVIADIAIVDYPADPSRVGEVLREFPILNVGIVMSLKKTDPGTVVLGRLFAKQTRAGQNPAIILSEYTPHDRDLAVAYMNGGGRAAPAPTPTPQPAPDVAAQQPLFTPMPTVDTAPQPPIFGTTAAPTPPPF